ncbi:PKD domain-containing protein [Candidatus Bipolaricaulota bacterium]|nr:PKD domain-containing protein [Candidatus Bipolaricaulota bacterium]
MRRRAIPWISAIILVLATVPMLAPDDPQGSVVINEICWAGSAQDPTAEWIELFNTTDTPLDLQGWQLRSSDGAPNILLKGIIQPHSSDDIASGYFLLERDSDDSAPGVDADLTYQGALTNRGEALVLIDSEGRVIDTANAPLLDDESLSWPAGSDDRGVPSFASMERVQFQVADEPANWASCTAAYPEDSSGSFSGTPKMENSAYNVLPEVNVVITPTIPHPGMPAQFNAEGSRDFNDPIESYAWDFGDGVAASGSIVMHTFPERGSYTITLTLTDSKGGQTTWVHQVLVALTTPPVADFSLVLKQDETILRVGDPITFQDESSDHDSELAAWKWQFGDGAEASGQIVCHSYTAYGEVIVGLRVTDTQGEVGVQTRSLSILSQLPVAIVSFSSERPNQGETIRFDASESFDPDGQIASYHWDFDGDGLFDTEGPDAIVDHAYDSGGCFVVRVQVVDDQSQIAFREATLNVNPAPVVAFQISNFEPLELESVTFTDLSTDVGGSMADWAWDFGDGTLSNERSPSHIYQQSGPMNVTLSVSDELGAEATAAAILHVGNLEPVAVLSASATTLPTGTRFSFDASTSSDPSPKGALTQYEWSLGEAGVFDLSTSSPTLTHAFQDDGQVAIRVRVTDTDGASAVSAPLVITVTNRAPVISQITWEPGAPLDGDEVVFTVRASDPDGEITGWTWALDTGARGSAEEFSAVFSDHGSYEISVTVRDDDGASSQPLAVTIPVSNASPVAQFSVVQGSACGLSGVRFNAAGSYDPSPQGEIVHMAWSFGDGTTCPGNSAECSDSDRWSPEHCYSAPGRYNVTLVVIDEHGAMSSTEKTILIGN